MSKTTEDTELKYKLTLIDQCLPDYFRGHHKPVMQIPVWKGMTRSALINEVVNDYNMIWDYLCEHSEYPWPEFEDGELFAMLDEFILVDKPFADSDIPTLGECKNDVDDVCIFIIL